MGVGDERYVYHCYGSQKQLASVHRISVKQRKGLRRSMLPWLFALVPAFYIFAKINFLSWIFLIIAYVFVTVQRNMVHEEVVILMPKLGVQLQTIYSSGKERFHFIPMEKILAVVINEAVTPTSCYFYLALVLKGEQKLTLVFKHFRPPLAMLRPVWDALHQEIRA